MRFWGARVPGCPHFQTADKPIQRISWGRINTDLGGAPKYVRYMFNPSMTHVFQKSRLATQPVTDFSVSPTPW